MSSNIHGLRENSENKGVGIISSSSYTSEDDRIYQPSIYKLRTVTSVLLIMNFSIFILQLIAFYSYYIKKQNSWECLLINFGAFQAGKIKNHYQFHRFITSMFLHNSMAHMGSNCLSLFFLGYQTENEIDNKNQYLKLYLISGLIGNFMSMLVNQINISAGASGAIIGLCGNFVIYFLLNYRKMSQRKKYSYGTLFLFLFINLFSGLAEGGENIDMASHIGGFLGGFAYSIILTYKNNIQLQFNNIFIRRLYLTSLAFLIILPLISIAVVLYKNVLNITDYICVNK